MKKIFIDGLVLVEGHFSGVGQYSLGILRGIDEIITDQKIKSLKTPRFTIIIPANTVSKFKQYKFRNIDYKVFPITLKLLGGLWHRGKLPFIDLYFGPGNYWFTRFVSMPLLSSKSFITIYDISFELYRQYSDEGNAIFLSNNVKKSIGKATKIITISQNAKKEIIDFYKVPPSMVKVATPAVDQSHFYRRSSQEIKKAKHKYGIDSKNYILALSNLEPRKNLKALVDAYCQLPNTYRKDTALLLVGVNGWKSDRLFEKIIKKIQEGYNIIRPSEYVSDDDKPAIISGASMLVYPSHYEGFGMPPLEALACGVPVITSDNSSLPEVVGDIGKMVPSNDSKKLLIAIKDYLDNLDSYTKKAIKEGPEHAKQFSWKKSAQVYYDLLKK